jgi:hypothetical protein
VVQRHQAIKKVQISINYLSHASLLLNSLGREKFQPLPALTSN